MPEHWVAEGDARQIIRMHASSGEDYLDRTTLAFGDIVRSATISGLTVSASPLA